MIKMKIDNHRMKIKQHLENSVLSAIKSLDQWIIEIINKGDTDNSVLSLQCFFHFSHPANNFVA